MRRRIVLGLLALALGVPSWGCRRGPSAPPAMEATASSARVEPSFVGEGALEVRTERGIATLALETLKVDAKTAGDVVEVAAEHVFRNDTDERLEGTFRFPLPAGAFPIGLAMEIDGRLVEGELVEREKARKAYEAIVDQMLDPALLEWESGQSFKLRVFPIEPKSTKRVVLRYIAPLQRSEGGLRFVFQAPDLAPAKVSLTVDGEVRRDLGDVPVGQAPAAVVERIDDVTFWAARIRPTFGGERAPVKPQAVIALCDRSRSMLEARALQAKTLGMIAGGLGAEDRVSVIVGDVAARRFEDGRLLAREDAARAAAFVDAEEPDGASDLGALLAAARPVVARARAEGFEPVVVYLGDGAATWGETRSAVLAERAEASLDGAPMHVLLLGRSVDAPAAQELAARAHGKVLRPRTEADAQRAAAEVLAARTQRRLDDVRLVGLEGLEVPSLVPSTLYEGDELSLAFRGAKAPASVALTGTERGRPVTIPVTLKDARTSAHVGKRWARQAIERLEARGGAERERVVATSLDHGVMSKFTAFLVLESEEAYERFRIERRAKREEPQVSGRDLDGDDPAASVTPDHLQPGDPEVRIPAPPDARSVVVVYPFGETKLAAFEVDASGRGAWVSRFLVDRRTPDGAYTIFVRITHADGRLETLELSYVVDTQRPNFDVTITNRRDGAFALHAKQRLTAEEIEAQAPSQLGTLEERAQRFAHVLTDAKRVEVQTPDGQTLALTHLRLGEFVGTWRPTSTAFDAGARLRFVAADRALNERVFELEVPR